jgi:hypothetical protein
MGQAPYEVIDRNPIGVDDNQDESNDQYSRGNPTCPLVFDGGELIHDNSSLVIGSGDSPSHSFSIEFKQFVHSREIETWSKRSQMLRCPNPHVFYQFSSVWVLISQDGERL